MGSTAGSARSNRTLKAWRIAGFAVAADTVVVVVVLVVGWVVVVVGGVLELHAVRSKPASANVVAILKERVTGQSYVRPA